MPESRHQLHNALEEENAPQYKHRAIWKRVIPKISMQTTFVAASLLCAYFAYESVHIRRGQVHKRAIDILDATEGAQIYTLKPMSSEWPRISDAYKEQLGMGDERLECIYGLPENADDAFLEGIHIDELQTVTLVDLRKTKITEKSMQKLCDLPRLRYLYLDDTIVGDEGIASLQSCTSLQSIHAKRTGITDKSLEYFSSLPKIESLEISGNSGITALGVHTYLPTLKHLDNLNVSNIPLGDRAFSSLANGNSALGVLYADDTGVSDEALEYIGAAGKKLHVLSLRDNQIAGSALHHLENHPELWGVDLSGNPLHEEGVKHLARMSSLKYLQLHKVALTSGMLKVLGKSTILEILELEHSPGIDDEGMRMIAEYPALRILHINGTAVTMDGILHLCEHAHSLECVKLDDTQVSDAQVEELKKRGNRVAVSGRNSTIWLLFPNFVD